MRKLFIAPVIFMLLFGAVPECFADGASVYAGSASAKPGNTIQISISLSEKINLTDLGLEVGYDASVLTLTGIEDKTAGDAAFITAQNYTANPYNFGWTDVQNNAFEGEIAVLIFSVSRTASPGEYPVTVSYYKGRNGSYVDGIDVNYDENKAPVKLSYSDGSVKITKNGISISDVCISFTISLDGAESGGTIAAALYDECGRLLAVNDYPAADSVNISFNKMGAYVKILWWDMEALIPLADGEKIII